VAVVDRSSARARNGGVADVDALVTREPGLGLVVLAADCLPVLLADSAAPVVAAVHAGRQGLAAGVVQAALAVMQQLGADPRTTTAVLGPAACGGCYEVPPELAAQVEAAVPGSRSTTTRGTDSVDLVAGATAVLRGAGLTDVRAVGGCTLEQPERFFSYRRDGRTGRHAGLVWLRP
jgi:YfiH family protein